VGLCVGEWHHTARLGLGLDAAVPVLARGIIPQG
jgi:hypothetical protein